jgi:hypothetical protein
MSKPNSTNSSTPRSGQDQHRGTVSPKAGGPVAVEIHGEAPGHAFAGYGVGVHGHVSSEAHLEHQRIGAQRPFVLEEGHQALGEVAARVRRHLDRVHEVRWTHDGSRLRARLDEDRPFRDSVFDRFCTSSWTTCTRLPDTPVVLLGVLTFMSDRRSPFWTSTSINPNFSLRSDVSSGIWHSSTLTWDTGPSLCLLPASSTRTAPDATEAHSSALRRRSFPA